MHETERFLIAKRKDGFGTEVLCCDWERYWIEWEKMSFPLSNDEGCDLMSANGWFLECDRDPNDGIRTTGPDLFQ